MTLSADQVERYARHIVLKEIGGPGQQKLLNAKVLVIGAGGLGAPILFYLAAAGVGTLGVVDDDTVSLSNLQRQIIHTQDRIGTAKTDSAGHALKALAPELQFVAHTTRLTAENGWDILSQYDLVVDGCDNFETRFLVNDLCYYAQIPLVSGAVGEFQGQIATFKGYERNAAGDLLPTYRCLVPEIPPAGAIPTCAEAGVLGALTGVVGSMQALEAIKEITGAGEGLAGRLVIYDGLDARVRTLTLKRDPANPLNGDHPRLTLPESSLPEAVLKRVRAAMSPAAD